MPQFQKPIKFTICNVLGEGSSAIVYRAFDENNRQDIAVKLVRVGAETIDAFMQEAQILPKLNHPNIVKCYGFKYKQKEGKLEIYLEYIDGGSIRSLLAKHKRFSEEITSKWTSQILNGLYYLHANNVIHRDIKGLNILVNKDGVAKLTDFGSAQAISGQMRTSVGSIFWMAPEVL